MCISITGKCEGGCQDGWTGIDCSTGNVTKSGKHVCPAPVSEVIKVTQTLRPKELMLVVENV